MRRIADHPALGALPEAGLEFEFNGERHTALQGDSIVSALLARDVRTLRRTRNTDAPRGVYCGIGHCFECRLTVDGVAGVRACLTPVTDGMVIDSEPTKGVGA